MDEVRGVKIIQGEFQSCLKEHRLAEYTLIMITPLEQCSPRMHVKVGKYSIPSEMCVNVCT